MILPPEIEHWPADQIDAVVQKTVELYFAHVPFHEAVRKAVTFVRESEERKEPSCSGSDR